MRSLQGLSPVVPLLVAGLALPSLVAGNGRDTFPDTWVATDALGRRLPTAAEVGAPRADRTVGIFYFLWLGPHAQPGAPWDITRILTRDPRAMEKPDSPLWGPLHAAHHWGESVFGYYQGSDPYVLRKHAQMLGDAGVDVVLFDVTNQLTYRTNYLALLRTWSEVRRDGGRTPQMAFLCPFGDPAKVVKELFVDLYEPGLHPELWFRWEAKPLILADPDRLPGTGEEARRIRQFFTFRRPQPDYFRGQTKPDMWSWLEVCPQHVFTNASGQREQMSAGVAQNAVAGRLGSMSEPGAHGRSHHRGAMDPRPGAVRWGLNFAEQFERVLGEDPRFLFITGWNEWIAGRFNEFNGIRRPVLFVDQFDQEHSRDIEPMKGGHGDDYYYQLVGFVRRYKGARPIPVAGAPGRIRLNGPSRQWASMLPEYRDDTGDTAHRDFPGYNGHTNYVNRTGRNDLVEARVARDRRTIWFLARTREAVTPGSDPNWMWLLIDADRDRATGWEGYDFILNRSGVRSRLSLLERNTGGWNWERVCEVELRASGREVQIAVPRRALGLEAAKGPLRFDFKWADNVPAGGSLVDWLDAGDTAPNGRFNYRFQELDK